MDCAGGGCDAEVPEEESGYCNDKYFMSLAVFIFFEESWCVFHSCLSLLL